MEHWLLEGAELGKAEGVALGLADGLDVGALEGGGDGNAVGKS